MLLQSRQRPPNVCRYGAWTRGTTRPRRSTSWRRGSGGAGSGKQLGWMRFPSRRSCTATWTTSTTSSGCQSVCKRSRRLDSACGSFAQLASSLDGVPMQIRRSRKQSDFVSVCSCNAHPSALCSPHQVRCMSLMHMLDRASALGQLAKQPAILTRRPAQLLPPPSSCSNLSSTTHGNLNLAQLSLILAQAPRAGAALAVCFRHPGGRVRAVRNARWQRADHRPYQRGYEGA